MNALLECLIMDFESNRESSVQMYKNTAKCIICANEFMGEMSELWKFSVEGSIIHQFTKSHYVSIVETFL